ncbi:MAG TPA: hypothetical protein VLH79_13900 [Chthonomonadales bacterium]|nr:hypothetical protein [Chthonomonadales bacterium]
MDTRSQPDAARPPHEAPFTTPAGVSRRRFVSGSLAAAAGAAVLAPDDAQAQQAARAPRAARVAAGSRGRLPTGKIGPVTVSRLISGGNLISGWAHARDLHYVAELMRRYNTDAKVLDTLQLMEEHGIDTIIADPRKKPMDLFARYWRERGGRMQWIAEGHPGVDDWRTDIRRSVDFGAKAVYVQGVIADQWLAEGRIDLLGQCVDFIKARGVPGGIGAHQIEVIVESEARGFRADFYMKTCHHNQYWSGRRPDQTQRVVENHADNYWDMDPPRTIEVMAKVRKPWIAFKVLAAGAIAPENGFRYALENGADFLCVGMFDFQVARNAALARQLVAATAQRARPWCA